MGPTGPNEVKKVFSKKGILEKQEVAREAYEKNLKELRQAIELIAVTPSGEKFLKYLFILCGGDAAPLRRDKEGKINVNETLSVLGAHSVWQAIRFNMTSDIIKNIERHFWEEQ